MSAPALPSLGNYSVNFCRVVTRRTNCFAYDQSEPNVQSVSRTQSWNVQVCTGHTTLGMTSPWTVTVWLFSVRLWPFGQVIDALKRLTDDGWHGAQCIGGGSAVTSAQRATLTRRGSLRVRSCVSAGVEEKTDTIARQNAYQRRTSASTNTFIDGRAIEDSLSVVSSLGC
jgi:hypothetical protein